MKNIIILGSTGSIGTSALRIVEERPDKFRVIGLAARSNLKKLAEQIEKFRPKAVCVADAANAKKLRGMVRRRVKILSGVEGSLELATMDGADVALSAMVGAAGLAPTLAAIKAGRDIALANKETMVTAGRLVMREAKANRVKIIPVDSEHSAIFQAMRGEKGKAVRKITLTASAGPFLNTPVEELRAVTVDQALNHPVWSMGPKITIDSATMMNKGLEVIEASWLFGLPGEKIETLVHPQSVIHSMVEFCDSSVMAQLGLPDMRTPISFALNYPDRLETALPSLDLALAGTLTFQRPDPVKYPALGLAYEALSLGGDAAAVLNAANEVAVEAFLDGRIRFTEIAEIVKRTVRSHNARPAETLAEVLEADKAGRAGAREVISELSA